MTSKRVTCRARLALLLLGSVLAGCGSDGRFSVSGSVTYDGEPVAKGEIGFVANGADADTYAGTEIVDGHYTVPAIKVCSRGPIRSRSSRNGQADGR